MSSLPRLHRKTVRSPYGRLRGHSTTPEASGTPSTLVFDRRARRLAVGTDGGEVSVWEFDPYRSTLCGTWRADDTLSALTFTKGGRHIVGLHSSGVVSIWKVRTGELVQRIARADKRFTAFAIAPHDATLAVGDDGGWIELVPISDVTARKWFRLG
jgi:WD40 repeat protein